LFSPKFNIFLSDKPRGSFGANSKAKIMPRSFLYILQQVNNKPVTLKYDPAPIECNKGTNIVQVSASRV